MADGGRVELVEALDQPVAKGAVEGDDVVRMLAESREVLAQRLWQMAPDGVANRPPPLGVEMRDRDQVDDAARLRRPGP